MSEAKTVDFFLGANTPEGFHSYFDAFDEPKDGHRRYLIKGGPGTGKSGLMKKVAAMAAQTKKPGMIERIHCSSDLDSLDAVIWQAGNCSIFDATPPHTVEPKYPGAYDRMVSITGCWDDEKLEAHQSEIVSLSARISALHRRCQTLMAAAGMLLAQNELLLSGYWMQEKLNAAAARFAKRLLCGQHGDGAKEDLRMLTALTNRGMVTFEQTVQTLADKIVCIKDPFGTVAQCYLRAVRQQAQKQGLHMILCASPLQVGKIDHILLPECRIAVVTQDRYQRFAHCENISVIRAGRFLPPKQLKQMKGAFRHRNRMTDQLLLDAAEALKQAKALHDQLEQHYTAAVDFEKVNRLTEQVIDEMKKRV